MKKLIYTIIALLTITSAVAQTTLPTSWGFTTATLPTGWTSAGGFTYYSGSGNPAPAAKFQATGDMLTIAFVNAPLALTYDLTGNSFVATGTFTVQESTDGITWTTLHLFGTGGTAVPSATYTPYSDAPNNATRFIRFNYTLKTGGNIGVDNVNITLGVSTAQSISVQHTSTTIVNGGMYPLSSPVGLGLPVAFSVLNLGTVGTLNLSSATITGPAAADFGTVTFPATVAPSGTGSLSFIFTPSVAGTRMADLNIASNDPITPTYVIHLYGVGGTLATEPANPATALTFSNIKSYRFKGTYTASSSNPDGYVILRKTGSAVTDMPVDGTVYMQGDMIGTSQVAYVGTSTSFAPHHIVAGTQYYFAIFPFNGPGVYRNYLTSSACTGNVTTLATMQPTTYYNTISTAAATFVADLHTLVNPHTHLFYSDYNSNMITGFESRDTTGGQKVVTCVYSAQNKVYTEPFDWTTNNFSREHTWCHQWMPTYPATTGPEYEDYHQLFPTNQNDVNAIRSNYPLGKVVTATYTFLGCKLGNDAAGHVVFEPRDSDKGDAARAMMYEAICYTTVAGNVWGLPNPISTSIPYGEDQNVLKSWNYLDPPDNWEIARNDFIDSLQGNRNPFVDSMQYACYINFDNMTKMVGVTAPCAASAIAEHTQNNDLVLLSPNPNNGNFRLEYISQSNQKISVSLYDVLGRAVYTDEIKATAGSNIMEMNISNLNNGVYTFTFISDKGRRTERMVINK